MFRVRTGTRGAVVYPFSFWQRMAVGSDSIVIGEPLIESGATLLVYPVPGGLTGELTTFTDAIPRDGIASATAPVRLTRVTCQ